MKIPSAAHTFIISLLVFLVATLVESSILSNIMILPAVPDLCLLCLLYISIQNGRLFGETMGFFSGLFLDFLGSGILGLNCLYRTVIGYLSGFFNKTFNVEGLFIPILLGGIATVAKGLFLWLISLLFPHGLYSLFDKAFLFELAENIILAPFVFKFLGLFRKLLIIRVESVM